MLILEFSNYFLSYVMVTWFHRYMKLQDKEKKQGETSNTRS